MAMATDGAEAAADGQTGRSLIVDQATFEEQFLRCQVCRESYDQEERSPKSLPCNHTFCLPCLKQVFDHGQSQTRRTLLWGDESLDGTLKCPQCRVEIYLSRGEIKKLPNDHRVIQMMDFLSQAVVKSQNVCSKHERQPLSFFCKKCLVPVCRDCTVLDHKEQQGHNIVDVSDALSESSEEFDEIENKSKKTLDRMKTRWDSLANASKRLDIQERQLRGQIKDTFIEYRLLLERRQEALISMLETQIKEQKKTINARFMEVRERGSELQNMFDAFSQARASNDIRTMFTTNQQMKDKEEEFKAVADVDDNELFISAGFEVQSEGTFLSEMSGLGEVLSKEDLQLKQPVPPHQLVIFDMEERRERERQYESQRAPFECEDFSDHQEDGTDILDEATIQALTERILSNRISGSRQERLHLDDAGEDVPESFHRGSNIRRAAREMLIPDFHIPQSSSRGDRQRGSEGNRSGSRSSTRRPQPVVFRHQTFAHLSQTDGN